MCFVFRFFAFLGLSLYGTMYDHVVVEHHIFYCIAVSQAQHSTAQQSARTTPQSKYVPIIVRQRKQADKQRLLYLQYREHSTAQHSAISPHKAAKQVRAEQSWREPAHAVEHAHSVPGYKARCFLKTNEEIEVCPACTNI